MIAVESADCRKVCVLSECDFSAFAARFAAQTGRPRSDLQRVRQLKISGCRVDTFAFLRTMPALQMVYFLACESDVWQTVSGAPEIISLGLHNLKQGKEYLSDTAFLRTFPNLTYLHVSMLGVGCPRALARLERLQVVMGSFRNENDKRKTPDFSPLRESLRLQVFAGYAAVDRHRIPVEAFVPILENQALTSFSYAQMFRVEDKKLAALIARCNPSLLTTTLSDGALLKIRREKFAD